MKWKPVAERLRRTVSRPESVLIIELASAAVLLAWVAHWSLE